MKVLNRIVAILLGITILPIRILIYNALYAGLLFVLGIVVTIELSKKLSLIWSNYGLPKTINLFLSFLVFPAITVMTTVCFILMAALLAFYTLFNMVESLWCGFKFGLLDGMDGFWRAFNEQKIYGKKKLTQLQAVIVDLTTEELIDDVGRDRTQEDIDDFQSVIVVEEHFQVPNIQVTGPKIEEAFLLTHAEIQNIIRIINTFLESKELLLPRVKETLNSLQRLLSSYLDLYNKLKKIRQALVDNDLSMIKDELIAFNEVEIPILLVKQYEKEGHWYHVPTVSYVTDKDSLMAWLKTNPRHPLNKDFLQHPSKYNDMETRYIWYELTKKNCTSQELVEAAVQMRVLAGELERDLMSQKNNLELFSLFIDQTVQEGDNGVNQQEIHNHPIIRST